MPDEDRQPCEGCGHEHEAHHPIREGLGMTIQCEEEGCACIDWEIPSEPAGTYACPWCGFDKPHPHTDEELLRLKVRKASQKAFERWFDGGVRQFRDVGMHWAWRQEWRARLGGNGFMIGGQTYYSAATEMHWATWLRGACYGAEYRNAEIEGLRAALAAAAEREAAYRKALLNVSVHSAHLFAAEPQLLSDLLTRCGEIARAALSPTPTEPPR